MLLVILFFILKISGIFGPPRILRWERLGVPKFMYVSLTNILHISYVPISLVIAIV